MCKIPDAHFIFICLKKYHLPVITVLYCFFFTHYDAKLLQGQSDHLIG